MRGYRAAEFQIMAGGWPHIPGAIAEFGVYNGGCTKQLAAFGRTVYAFDTYEGIPAEDFTKGLDHDIPGKFRPVDLPEVMFANYPNIIPVEGRYANTLPEFDPEVKFYFVYMDCDLYHSYAQVLAWLEHRLVPGASILIDDYSWCQGARKAVDEWVAKCNLNLLYDGQIIIWPGEHHERGE